MQKCVTIWFDISAEVRSLFEYLLKWSFLARVRGLGACAPVPPSVRNTISLFYLIISILCIYLKHVKFRVRFENEENRLNSWPVGVILGRVGLLMQNILTGLRMLIKLGILVIFEYQISALTGKLLCGKSIYGHFNWFLWIVKIRNLIFAYVYELLIGS